MAVGSITVSIADSPDDLRDLVAWLRMEDGLRGRVQAASKPVESGHMGGVLDTVGIAVGSGGLAVTFVRSLFLWLGTRKSSLRTQLTLRTAGGREVMLDLPDKADLEVVLNQINRFFESEGK